MTDHRALAGRMRWGLADQAISSLTNFVLAVCVARVSSPQTFGAFSVAFIVYLLAVALCRSLVTEPFVIRYSGRSRCSGDVVPGVAGSALAFGLVLAAAVAGVATVVGGLNAGLMIVLAGMLPALLLQDALRSVLVAEGRPAGAAAVDAVWLVLQLMATAVLASTGRLSASTLLSAFGVGAGISAIVAMAWVGAFPDLRRAGRWLRAQADLGLPLVVELLVVNGASPVALLAVAATGEQALVGRMRAALLLFGPLTMVLTGLVLAGLPEAVRLQSSPRRLRRFLFFLGLAMPCLAALWTLGLLLIPGWLGTFVLGANWAGVQALVPATGLFVASSGCTFAALVGMRAAGAVGPSLRARVWSVPVTWAGGLLGAAWGGPAGAAAGIAVGSCLDAVLVWAALRRLLASGTDREEVSFHAVVSK